MAAILSAEKKSNDGQMDGSKDGIFPYSVILLIMKFWYIVQCKLTLRCPAKWSKPGVRKDKYHYLVIWDRDSKWIRDHCKSWRWGAPITNRELRSLRQENCSDLVKINLGHTKKFSPGVQNKTLLQQNLTITPSSTQKGGYQGLGAK